MNIEEVVGFPFLMALIGWVVWLIYKKTQGEREERMRHLEFQKEIIRKFTTSESMIEFLKTDEGRRCFPADPAANPRLRNLRSLALGVTLILFGIAMAAQGYSWNGYEDMNYVNKMHEFYYWGSVMGSGGAGLILHALMSGPFVKKWNLIRDDV